MLQGFGILTSGVVALVVSAALDNATAAPPYAVDRAGSTVPQADYVWRIILMFGAVPAALADEDAGDGPVHRSGGA